MNFIYVDKAGKIYWLDNNGAVNRIDDMTGANHLTFGANILGGSPTSIAVDSSNRIYVWDGSFRVIRFDDMTGKNIVYYGAQGSGVGHFNTLSSGSLSIDSTNRIYIADQSNKRIVRIDDMTGANWTEFDIPADSGTAVNPDKVSVDSSATPSIYFMVQSTGTVFKCSDMAGTGLTKLGTFANGVTPLHFPSAISVK